MKNLYILALFAIVLASCQPNAKDTTKTTLSVTDTVVIAKKNPNFQWEAATVYFLLTDRFNNGNPENDLNFDRDEVTGKLRGFMGGDIQGITQKMVILPSLA